MKLATITLVLFLLTTTFGWCDLPGSVSAEVVPHKLLSASNLEITSSNSIDVTSAAVETESIDITRTENHSIELRISVPSGSVSIEIEVLGSNNNVDFVSFDSALTLKEVTGDYHKIQAVSIPSCKYVKFSIPKDGSSVAFSVTRLWVSAW